MLEGKDDPLRWLWEGHPQPMTRPAAPFEGLASLVKVVGYQAWVYADAAIASLTPRGRRELRFWNLGPRFQSASEPSGEAARTAAGEAAGTAAGDASYSIRSSRSSSRS